jgi:hypothetical protein
MLPAIVDFEQLGGALQNYAPVEDPLTDLDASADNETRANVAAATQTQPRALCSAFIGLAPALSGHRSVWGNLPAVAPAIARVALGEFTITWPPSIVDKFNVTHFLSFFAVFANISTALGARVNATVDAPNRIKLYVYDAAGAASDVGGSVVHVVVH